MLLNIDQDVTTVPFLLSLEGRENLTEADFYPFVDEFSNANITDVLFNINAQASATESAYFDNYANKYLQSVENDIAVDYKDVNPVKAYYLAKYKYRVDPFDVWIRRAWDIGINPWLSFRMNDCHFNNEPTSWIRDSYFYEAMASGLMLGKKYGYYHAAYNYKYSEIRRKFLGYIEEQLARYDVYGIELDFMREIYCFDYIDDDHDECVCIMNDFIRSVKKIVTDMEAARGHRIKIAIRLTRDLEKSLRFGFDAVAWAREGLVDIIIPSPRWNGSDSAIPIDEWKSALPDVEIYGCIETCINASHPRQAMMSVETALGHAASLLSRGADEIYLFNYFCGDGNRARDKELHAKLGSYADIVKHPMRFVVIDEDNDIFPRGTVQWKQLPIIPAPEKTITIKTGNLPEDKTVKLILAFDEGTPADTDVLINGVSVGTLTLCAPPDPKSSAYTDGADCYCATVALASDTQNITVKNVSGNRVVISWLELDVR